MESKSFLVLWWCMVDFRLKPFNQALTEQARREAQKHVFRRNQAIGLLVIAAAVLTYRLLHTPAGWIFPAGWWRLW